MDFDFMVSARSDICSHHKLDYICRQEGDTADLPSGCSTMPGRHRPTFPSGGSTVPEAVLSPFAAWENFYVIIGSSAAALIGLQFVVIALVADSRTQSTSREIAAFGTPTILHFSAVLLLAAILSAPWQTLAK